MKRKRISVTRSPYTPNWLVILDNHLCLDSCRYRQDAKKMAHWYRKALRKYPLPSLYKSDPHKALLQWHAGIPEKPPETTAYMVTLDIEKGTTSLTLFKG